MRCQHDKSNRYTAWRIEVGVHGGSSGNVHRCFAFLTETQLYAHITPQYAVYINIYIYIWIIPHIISCIKTFLFDSPWYWKPQHCIQDAVPFCNSKNQNQRSSEHELMYPEPWWLLWEVEKKNDPPQKKKKKSEVWNSFNTALSITKCKAKICIISKRHEKSRTSQTDQITCVTSIKDVYPPYSRPAPRLAFNFPLADCTVCMLQRPASGSRTATSVWT